MPHSFTEDDLRAFVGGTALPALAADITAQMADDPGLRAEVAVLQGVAAMLAQDAANAQPDELGWRRLEARIKAEQQAAAPPRQSNFWRAAAVACGLIIVGQGAYISTGFGPSAEARYETATAADTAYVLALAFEDDANMAEVSALLRSIDGVVIDGPSAIGLYRVSFAADGVLEAAQDTLSTSDLVRLVAAE